MDGCGQVKTDDELWREDIEPSVDYFNLVHNVAKTVSTVQSIQSMNNIVVAWSIIHVKDISFESSKLMRTSAAPHQQLFRSRSIRCEHPSMPAIVWGYKWGGGPTMTVATLHTLNNKH